MSDHELGDGTVVANRVATPIFMNPDDFRSVMLPARPLHRFGNVRRGEAILKNGQLQSEAQANRLQPSRFHKRKKATSLMVIFSLLNVQRRHT
jgi:hypothetical protein